MFRAFRGFFAFKEKVRKLSQITVFSYKFGGFFGGRFGGKRSPKRHVKLCVILFGKSPDYYPQHKNSYPPIFKKFPQKSLKNIDRYHCCTCSSTSDVEGRISWEIQNLTIYLSFGIIKREYI